MDSAVIAFRLDRGIARASRTMRLARSGFWPAAGCIPLDLRLSAGALQSIVRGHFVMGLPKPIILISYSHRDEPEHPRDGEVQWLSFVRTYLQPAVKHGVFNLWVDRHMMGGEDWDPEIERNLRECDIFILLVSAHAMASDYIIDKEIAVIRERQARGEPVHFYPLLLTPKPQAGLEKVKDKNLRPRDGKPFSVYSAHDRQQHMSDAADEIAQIAERIAKQKSAAQQSTSTMQPAYVHITGLPETGYERLVGRDAELKRLDEACADRNTDRK